MRNQQRSEGASLGESSALNNPSTDLRWRQNKRCFSLCDWHQMGPAPTNSKQVPSNMPPQFARSQLFPYTLLEMFGAARGNLLFPSSVFHDLKDRIPALLVCFSTPICPQLFLSFLNKFCQSWRMTQCCLTTPSNYYTYRSAFECSPHRQHLRNTYRKPSVEARRCISQPLLGLYVMLLFRCSSFMDLHRHRGFQADVWGRLLVTPFQNGPVSHDCTYTPGPETRVSFALQTPSRTASRGISLTFTSPSARSGEKTSTALNPFPSPLPSPPVSLSITCDLSPQQTSLTKNN